MLIANALETIPGTDVVVSTVLPHLAPLHDQGVRIHGTQADLICVLDDMSGQLCVHPLRYFTPEIHHALVTYREARNIADTRPEHGIWLLAYPHGVPAVQWFSCAALCKALN